ncbi:MAG: hypothetical protein J7L66_06400 [Anaerolineaceae bacterium]|nr:hypothetical protein [Anaerolineaceae bacterium]
MGIIKYIKENKYIYWVVLIIIGFLFFAQAFSLAHRLPSRVDEGSFLIKGYYFVSGKYKPFEDYGPWTNNMPLAFLIPGVPQYLFGPGIRTGRYFAIFMAFMNLIGLWVLMKGLRGKWWALIPALAFSLNPSWIAANVQAVSQGIVACIVTWMMVLLLGKERSSWRIAAAALLSAATTLTRQNMVFLMPFVVLYVWWRCGFKKALIAFICAFIPFIVVHVLYYPKIMNLWYTWLPRSIKYALGVGSVAGGGTQVWKPAGELIDRLSSFFMAVRYHFFSLFGIAIALVLITRKRNWRSENERKAVLAMLILFALLFGLHAWASLMKNYCIFCFPNYIFFFIPIGMIVSVLTISNVLEKKISPSVFYIIALVLVLIPGIFFSSSNTVGKLLLQIPVPRFKEGKFIGGVTFLWELVRNRFNIPYDQLVLILPPIIGFLAAIVFLVIFFIAFRAKGKEKYGYFLVIGICAISLVLTPTNLLGGYPVGNECGGDVIGAYETAGRQLQGRIPAGSSVYWGSGSVVTPLLYITDAGIQPLQLNGVYPKRKGGDRALLERDGYFNEESKKYWRDSSEFILIQSSKMVDFWKQYLNPEDFVEYEPTVPIDPCDPNSSIQIFRRK